MNLEKLKKSSWGICVWIILACAFHLTLFISKGEVDIALWQKLLYLVGAVLVALEVHELFHWVFMTIFCKKKARIEFAKDALGIPTLRTVLPGKVSKLQWVIILLAPLFFLTVMPYLIFPFLEKINMFLYLIPICNAAGCYYDLIDVLIAIRDWKKKD